MGTREKSKKRKADLEKGFPLRDKRPFKDLPNSVKKGAAERNPRVTSKPPKTSGGFNFPGKSKLQTGSAKVIDNVIQGPEAIVDSPGRIVTPSKDKKVKKKTKGLTSRSRREPDERGQ